MPSPLSLTSRLISYRDSLGNQESRALIADALDELSSGRWRESMLVEALKATRSNLADLYASFVIGHEPSELVASIRSVSDAIAFAESSQDPSPTPCAATRSLDSSALPPNV